jgi:hypothetical protein
MTMVSSFQPLHTKLPPSISHNPAITKYNIDLRNSVIFFNLNDMK